MTIVATINAPSGDVFSFDKFLTSDGRVPDQPVVVEEELIAVGVDGRRFRDLGLRYPEFTAMTLETVATYQAGVTKARKYDKLVGQVVTLQITNLGGTATYSYQTVHVKAATPRVVPGAVAGSATPTNAAHIEATLTLVLMDLISGLNP